MSNISFIEKNKHEECTANGISILQNVSFSIDHSRTENISHEVVVFVLSLIFLLDVAGNLIVVAVIFLARKMKTFTNWMILNLAVTDLAIGLFCIPLEIPLELSHKWLYGQFFCKIFYPLQSALIYASVFTLVVTSCSRYYAISQPFCPQPSTLHARWFICGIWLCSLMLEIPLMITLNLDEEACECKETWSLTNRRWFTIVTFLSQYILPLLIIITAHSLTLYEMSPKHILPPTEDERNKQKENKKVTKLLFAVTGTFALCVLPYHVLGLFAEFGDAHSYAHIDDLFYVSYFVLYLNSAMNPILYNVFNSSFREAFSRLRRKMKNKNTNIRKDTECLSLQPNQRTGSSRFNRSSRRESYRSG